MVTSLRAAASAGGFDAERGFVKCAKQSNLSITDAHRTGTFVTHGCGSEYRTYRGAGGCPILTASSAGDVLPLIPYLDGSGFPVIPLAFKANNVVNLTVPAATMTIHVVGAPELTLTYSGTGSGRHVYAQLVDDTTGLVLGNIVTPIPVTLDGQTHTVYLSLEPVAHTLPPGETVTLQLASPALTSPPSVDQLTAA